MVKPSLLYHQHFVLVYGTLYAYMLHVYAYMPIIVTIGLWHYACFYAPCVVGLRSFYSIIMFSHVSIADIMFITLAVCQCESSV